MWNGEDAFLDNIDWKRKKREELPQFMEEAYRKSILTLRKYAIEERDFMSVYPPAEVRADILEATHLRSKFDLQMEHDLVKKNFHRMADVLEAIVLEEAEQSEWLGKNVHTYKASDHDDLTNGVDMIAEWNLPREGSTVVGLAVDATFSANDIWKKLEHIKNEIDRGEMGSIKYFKDMQGNVGPQHNVPHLVIGLGQPGLEQLARLWVDGGKKKLGEHPAQKIFLMEMRYQLQMMEGYARRTGKIVAADAYKKALTIVAPLEESKRGIDLGEMAQDEVALAIIRNTKMLFGEKKKEEPVS